MFYGRYRSHFITVIMVKTANIRFFRSYSRVESKCYYHIRTNQYNFQNISTQLELMLDILNFQRLSVL